MAKIYGALVLLLIPQLLFAQTAAVSIDSLGTPADGASNSPSISSDSSLVAYSSDAANLVSGDSNGVADIFLSHQTIIQGGVTSGGTVETQRVSVSTAGAQANGASHSPSLSATSGRFVAFVSAADNLVAGDTNGSEDIFIRDRTLAQTFRISVPHDVGGTVQGEANGASFTPHISNDGCFVVFASDATNLNPLDSIGVPITDTNGKRDIFLYYNPNGQDGCFGGTPYIELVSIAPGDTLANDDSSAPFFSTVRFISFTSKASNLVSGDTNGVADIFVRDRAVQLDGINVSRLTVLASVSSDGTLANGESFTSSMDDSVIAFDSSATNLVANDNNGKRDIFKRALSSSSRTAGTTELVSQTIAGVQGDGDSFSPSIADGANYIAFASDATNLSATRDCNLVSDIFVRDYILQSLRRVNLTTAGYQASESSLKPALAGGALTVAYQTESKLNQSDSNGLSDIYLSVASEDPSAVDKPFERGARLDEGPDVCVSGKKANITLERFSAVSTEAVGSQSVKRVTSYPCRGQGICYEINANPVKSNGKIDKKRDRVKLVQKRNTVTVPKLRPGNYAVSFRVFGKSNSKVIKSNQSPARTITVR